MAVRVVAADGHQIEVGVEFDVAAPAPTATTEAPAPSEPPTSPPVSEVPATTEPAPASTPPPTIEPAIDDPSSADGAADAALEAIDSAGLERWDDLQTGLRPIAYVLAIVLVGATAFGSFVRIDGPTGIERSWLRWSGIGLVAATLLWLGFQSAIVRDAEAAAMFEPNAWSDALVGSIGTGFWLRLLGAAACVASTWLAGRAAGVVALGGAGLVALSFGLLGHSATASPQWLAVTSSGIHVAAYGVWIGGLLMLLLAMHPDRDADDQLIRRFSRVAAWSLVPVIAAGITLAIIRLDTFGDLFDTSYGRLLIAKVLVVIAILALGARNNKEVRCRSVGLAAHVARYGRLELILAALVLLLTTILVAAA